MLITAPKIHTDLLWDLSLLFIGIAVVYFFAIFLFKKRLTKLSKKTKKIKQRVSPMISEFIFLEEDASKDEKSSYVNLKVEIRELIKGKFYRKVVTEILLDLRKDVSGVAQKRLFELYKDLGLHKESYKKLKSLRWEAISQGIRELTQMQVAESYGFVTKFINDKRPTIRKQAEIAVVTLKHEGIDYFLDTTKHRISEWQQLKLLEVLGGQKDFQPPSFKMWLTSKNKYVVLFALRLIKHYDQNDASTSIIELVKHKNNRIKREAIACIKLFHITHALETLQTVFWNCTVDTKIAILDAIGNLGSEEEVAFLRLIDNKEPSFSVRSKALAAINMISPEAVLPTEGILDTEKVEIPKDIKEKKKEVMEDHNTLDEYIEPPINEPAPEEAADEHLLPQVEQASQGDETDIIPNEVETTTDIISNVAIEQVATDEDHTTKDPIPIIEPMKKGDLPKDVFQSNKNKNVTNSEEALAPEKTTDKDETLSKREITPVFSVDFLPLIVEEKGIGVIPDEKEMVLDHMQLEVLFDEVEIQNRVNERADLKDTVIRFDVTEADMHFIPIVVATQDEEVVQHDRLTIDGPGKSENLNEIAVVYEEIEVVVKTEVTVPTDPLDINVVYEELAITSSRNDYETVISDTTVVYEEITVIPTVEGESTTPSEIIELDPISLDVIYEEIQVSVREEEKTIDSDMESIAFAMTVIYEEIKGVDLGVALSSDPQTVLDLETMEVSYQEIEEAVASEVDSVEEEIEEQQLPNWLLEEIASPAKASSNKEPIQMEGPDWDAKTFKMTHEINYFLQYLPEPKMYENDLNNTMQLLDDIDFFGDEREIPLLEELMQKEEKEVTQSRIKDIMARFQGNNKSNTDGESETDISAQANDVPYSIFEEFFRHCDTESKLILLGEIAPVGDEKELYFLEQLLDDPEPRIRDKASSALAQLKERLGSVTLPPKKENNTPRAASVPQKTDEEYEQLLDEMEIAPPKESDIFDIGFELLDEGQSSDGPKEVKEDSEDTTPYNSRLNAFKKSRKKRPNDDG